MSENARGSALLMAVFVLALLSSMAIIIIFVSQTEGKMSAADARAKRAFYLAEAGTQHGREQLRLNLIAAANSALKPRLDEAAGVNTTVDFDPTTVQPQFSGGTLTGFTGVGDDVPLVAATALGDGWYAAFITNDPADGETNTTDTNDFVMITGLGIDPSGSFETAQVIIKPGSLFPMIPATVLLLGPDPDFKLASGKGWADIECDDAGGKYWIDGAEVKGSKLGKAMNGTDCQPYREVSGVGPEGQPQLVPAGGTGGIPGMFVPTYGAVGLTATEEVEDEIKGSKIDYVSDLEIMTQLVRPDELVGGYQDEASVADMTDPTEPTVIGSGLGTLDPTWTDCNALKNIVEDIRNTADTVCVGNSCSLPATTPSSVTFIDGDFRMDCYAEGFGLLAVTGQLDFPSTSSWHGVIFVIGEGWFFRVKKEGVGNITGGMVVADIAGPDDTYGTADDCTGGTNGFDQVYFREHGKGRGTTNYCTADIAAADPAFRQPAEVVSFRRN